MSLKKELKRFEDVQILLSIPSISLDERRKIISKLERLKVDVRSIPSLHEIVADRKKMTDIQPLSIDDIFHVKGLNYSKKGTKRQMYFDYRCWWINWIRDLKTSFWIGC